MATKITYTQQGDYLAARFEVARTTKGRNRNLGQTAFTLH